MKWGVARWQRVVRTIGVVLFVCGGTLLLMSWCISHYLGV